MSDKIITAGDASKGVYPVIGRGQLLDFILMEESSATRRTRKTIPLDAGTQIGDLVGADGKTLKFSAAADATKIAGIALDQPGKLFNNELTSYGDQVNAVLAHGYARVRELPQWADQVDSTITAALKKTVYAAILAQLESVEIKVVPVVTMGL